MKPSTRTEPVHLGEHQGHDIYPMPMFLKRSTDDVDHAVDWYARALGFACVYALRPDADGPVVMAHLRGAKYQDVMLVQGPASPATDAAPAQLDVVLHHDDVAALRERALHVSSACASEVRTTAWGTLELDVIEPTGLKLTFSQRNAGEQEEVWRERFAADDSGL